jgi:hypothetical protein
MKKPPVLPTPAAWGGLRNPAKKIQLIASITQAINFCKRNVPKLGHDG